MILLPIRVSKFKTAVVPTMLPLVPVSARTDTTYLVYGINCSITCVCVGERTCSGDELFSCTMYSKITPLASAGGDQVRLTEMLVGITEKFNGGVDTESVCVCLCVSIYMCMCVCVCVCVHACILLCACVCLCIY